MGKTWWSININWIKSIIMTVVQGQPNKWCTTWWFCIHTLIVCIKIWSSWVYGLTGQHTDSDIKYVTCKQQQVKGLFSCLRWRVSKNNKIHALTFLAHLSTKCSWWAIVVSGCPSLSVVRRPSCVVRQHLMFTL